MQPRHALLLLCTAGWLAFACGTGGKPSKSANDAEDIMVWDEEAKGFECDRPQSQCEEVEDPSLDFKERCRNAGYKIRQCGCRNACTGNINGERVAYDYKNVEKRCPKTDDKCEAPETRAAFQDACDEAGHQLVECGCDWLCSGKLKEPLDDPPKEEEAKPDGETKPDGEAEPKGKDADAKE